MADGFFLGGMAEGISDAQKQALAERTQTEKTGIAGRELDIKNQLAQHTMSQDMIARADALIANTMAPVTEFIKQGLAVGADPTMLRTKAQAAIDTVKPIAIKFGRNPAALDQQVEVLLAGPTGLQAGTAAGRAKGAEIAQTQITGGQMLTQPQAGGTGGAATAPAGVAPSVTSIILDPAKRAEAAGKLADDFARDSKNFVAVRDAKNSFDSIDPKLYGGAADLALVYNFYKMLEPNGRVTDAEFKIAGNIAGLPGAVERFRNQVFGQGNLSEAARTELKGQAEAAYQRHALQHDKLQTHYANKAKRFGINPMDVVPDLMPPGKIPEPPAGFVRQK